MKFEILLFFSVFSQFLCCIASAADRLENMPMFVEMSKANTPVNAVCLGHIKNGKWNEINLELADKSLQDNAKVAAKALAEAREDGHYILLMHLGTAKSTFKMRMISVSDTGSIKIDGLGEFKSLNELIDILKTQQKN